MRPLSGLLPIALVGMAWSITGTYAQGNCISAKRLYDEAHCAQAMRQFEKAIQIYDRLASFPRECRLEDDAMLRIYQNNLRKLIARDRENPPTIEIERPLLKQAGCTVQ